MKKLTDTEMDALYFELGTTFETTLTEARYNEIMDLLRPTLEDFPDAVGTLEGFGKEVWRERRAARTHPPRASAA